MGLFPCFPPVKRFCFCTRNLKCASVLIIVIGMISSIHRVAIVFAPQCKALYNYASPVRMFLLVLVYLHFIFEFILLASGFLLLLSIFFKSNARLADFYICCALFTAVLTILLSIIEVIQGYYVKCGFQVEVLNFFVYFVIWIYFVLVINTFRDEIK